MSEQLAYTIIAASTALISAILFCMGSVSNSYKKILLQATPMWDFNESVARALAEQRSQYIAGAVILVFAFVFQVVAALASSSISIALPIWLQKWYWLVVATLLLVGGGAMVLARVIFRSSIAKILILAGEQT